MIPSFTANGIEVQTFEEIYDTLSDGYKTIYGSDIDVSVNSPDGQRIAIEAQARLDLQSFGVVLYNQLDPDFALGASLNRMIKFSGISRNPSFRSQVDVTITTDRVIALPINYIVEDTLGQQWVTLTEWNLTSGANAVTLFSQEFGAIAAGVATVTNPLTIIIGIVSVTNAAIATVGEAEETDEDLRIRRNLSLLAPATSSVGGLYTAIGDINGVLDLKIYENYTDTVDALTVPAHSIWCIIDGGSIADIAEVLAKTKNAGTGLKGAVEGTYVEEITLPNGDIFNYTHIMEFDRPTDEDLYVEVTVTRKDATIPVDTTLIQNALVATTFSIGESSHAGELYSVVYGAGDTFVATLLEVKKFGGAFTDASIAPETDGRFTISAINVDITEVP